MRVRRAHPSTSSGLDALLELHRDSLHPAGVGRLQHDRVSLDLQAPSERRLVARQSSPALDHVLLEHAMAQTKQAVPSFA